MAPSFSTRPSSNGPGRWRSSSPAHGRTRRTIKPRSSPRTTISCASTGSTTATTPTEERAVLNRLWKLVNDRLNYLTPTIKPIGYGCGRDGQRRRLYDEPMTPLDRLLAAGILSPAQESELLTYRDSLNPAAIGRQIADLQSRPAQTRQGQDRTALPRRHPHRPTRGQIRHPHQEPRPPADPVSRAFLT